MSRIFIGIVICLVSTEMNTGILWVVGKLKLLFQNQFQRYLRNFLPGKGSQDKFLLTNFQVENNWFIWFVFLCLTKSSLHSNTSYMLSTQTKKQTHKKKKQNNPNLRKVYACLEFGWIYLNRLTNLNLGT